MAERFSAITVLGAGSWGTALALYLSRRGQEVRVWSIDQSEITAMLADGSNERYLPGHKLPPSLKPIMDLETAVQNIEDILLAIPSVGFKSTLNLLKPFIKPSTRFICATKGLDSETGQLCNEMTEAIIGSNPFAVLSGPSFAKEVASGLPTAVIIASHHQSYAKEVCERFHSPIFHAYPWDDVVGVEISAVIKNVIAIATGISDGMQLGTNARSALITCGLHEIIQLGLALGAKLETFTTLAGIGDLILTCSDDQSRNRRLGLAIGKGKSITEAEREIGQIVEGKRNAELVVMLAQKKQIQMPICTIITEILKGKLTAQKGYEKLLGSSKK